MVLCGLTVSNKLSTKFKVLISWSSTNNSKDQIKQLLIYSLLKAPPQLQAFNITYTTIATIGYKCRLSGIKFYDYATPNSYSLGDTKKAMWTPATSNKTNNRFKNTPTNLLHIQTAAPKRRRSNATENHKLHVQHLFLTIEIKNFHTKNKHTDTHTNKFAKTIRPP